jgi:hypothetical protein
MQKNYRAAIGSHFADGVETISRRGLEIWDTIYQGMPLGWAIH